MKVNAWVKAMAPSNELRQWFGNESTRWKEFQRRYFAELVNKPECLPPPLQAAREGNINLVFNPRDLTQNNAVALKRFRERRLKSKGPRYAFAHPQESPASAPPAGIASVSWPCELVS